MRYSILILTLLFVSATSWAQDCERKRDEFDQATEIICDPVEVDYMGDSVSTKPSVWAYWGSTSDDYGVGLWIPAQIDDATDALFDDRADLIIGTQRDSWPIEAESEGLNIRVYLPLHGTPAKDGDYMARRIARADTMKIRVAGMPFDISPVTDQMARLLRMTRDAPFSEDPKQEKESVSDTERVAAPYKIEGLDRELQFAPLPSYTEQVEARIRIRITVNSEGRIIKRVPVSDGNPELKSAVMDALQRWRFNSLSSVSQKIQTGTITFNFQRNESSQQSGTDGKVAPSDEEKSKEKSGSDEVYVVVEQQPDCGGVDALQKKVNYPDFAQKAGIEGRVLVQFVVNQDGEVVQPKVTRGHHKLLNEEALRAVQELDCKPGKKHGKPVKVQMSLPVTFRQ